MLVEETKHGLLLYGAMPVELDVQRSINRADMWTLHMALTRLSGPAVIFTDHRGVVHALRRRETTCIGPKHEDADWWKLNWVHEIQDVNWHCQVQCTQRRNKGGQ